MPYQEGNRYLYLTTPLGEDKLLLSGFTGHEAISQLFHFKLRLMAENATSVDFDKLIGQKVSFGVQGTDPRQEPRDLHGIVIELAQGARDREFTEYSMTIAPEIWKLTRKFRSRIFQHMAVPDVLKQVFAGFDAAYELQGDYKPREYITQYQETDFAFASRLMEEEGIYYFFKFTRGAHKLVLADTRQSHPDVPGDSELIFEPVAGGEREEERISIWQKAQAWGSGKYTLWDHHFQIPHKHLEATETVVDTVQAGKVMHKLKLAGNDDFEILEHPGRYARRFDGINKGGGEQPGELSKIYEDNLRTDKIRMEQTEVPMLEINGAGNHRQITSGHKFTLQRHFNGDGQYVITKASHRAHEGGFRTGEQGGAGGSQYANTFSCIPYHLPFRPQRETARPVIAGPVTAIVVGPAGEEIFTDKYGRVKVKFMWDPAPDSTDNSCWVRVATFWAGKNWGAIHIPRIGQEVVVAFENGDPDHPIVMGSVYNADQIPPYTLPDRKTVSTMKSHSSKGGGQNNYNEFRFEDLKGSEQIYLQAERDMDQHIKHDSREYVGNDRHLTVGQNQGESVSGWKHSTVGGDYVFNTGGSKHITTGGGVFEQTAGDHELTLGGNNVETIAQENMITIGGNQSETIGGSVSLTVGGDQDETIATTHRKTAGTDIHLTAGANVTITAGAQLTLKSSGGFITIGPSGIAIQGTLVMINSGGAPGVSQTAKPKSAKSPKTKVKSPIAPDKADDGTKFNKQ